MLKLFSLFMFMFVGFSDTTFAINIPLKSQILNINLPKDYKVEKKCLNYRNISCYEINNTQTFFSLYITDLSKNKDFDGSLKKLCKGPLKRNKNKLEYCRSGNSYLVTKNNQLINVSAKGKDIESLISIIEVLK